MKRISIFVITVVLISGLLSCSDGSYPDGYPDIPEDAALAVDQRIGSIDVEYWERVVDDVFHVLNDYILIHLDPDTGEVIKCEQQWRDIDVDLADIVVEPFEPPSGEYFRKRVAVFLEDEDTGDFYAVSNSTEYPLVCWEIRYSDGTTALYGLNESEIGGGIPAPSDGFSLSGYHDPSDPDPWERYRENADAWFQRWSITTTSLSLPTPTIISSYVSDAACQYYYALAHGGSSSFQADTTGSYYRASDAEADMEDRDPMVFAFIGHCEGMTQTGSGSFSHAFRKGSMADTVTVGYSGMGSSPGWWFAFQWQDAMFERIDDGHTFKDAFDLACAQYPLIADAVVFVGDPDLTLPTGEDSYDLTVTSTTGGSVIAPGEGTFDYSSGSVVQLVADAEEGYQFSEWTGGGGSIAYVYSPVTTITMNGDRSVTANFLEAGYDIVLEPADGVCGEVVGATATVWAAGYYYVCWDSAAPANVVAEITAVGSGTYDVAFPIPEATPGYHAVYLTDATYRDVAADVFRVNP